MDKDGTYLMLSEVPISDSELALSCEIPRHIVSQIGGVGVRARVALWHTDGTFTLGK
jgi:hypothetical protein